MARTISGGGIRTGVAALVLGIAAPLWAQQPAATPVQTVPGWEALVAGIRDLPATMLAKLPPEQRDDPQIRQEIGRLALSGIASSVLAALGADGDHPVFLPGTGNVITTGQPNADTSYRSAQITPGGIYRLRGVRGSARMVRIAESGPPPARQPASQSARQSGGGQPVLGVQRIDHDLNALGVDGAGRYDVILSPVRPAGYRGDWWPLQPAASGLLLRIVKADWNREIEPTVSIERVDVPAPRPRPPAARLEAALRKLPQAAGFIAPLFVDHVAQLRRQGYVNRLKEADFSKIGGLAGQFYYEGAYELADDEALIVEAKMPAKCLYRSIILTNDLYETSDWYNNHSSLNDTQAKADGDGILRIVVSARDPGVPNWLDTAGYPSGVIQGRWTECDSQPVPTVRKVALADVRTALPRGTGVVSPAEREATIRARRAALQQRPLW